MRIGGRGKKIDMLTILTDRVVSKRFGHEKRAEFQVELRLDQRGIFHALYQGVWYDDPTQKGLTDKIRKAVHRTIDVTWTRYCLVDYSATACALDDDSNRPDQHGGTVYDIDADRTDLDKPDRSHHRRMANSRYQIKGLDLTWDVVDYSSAYERPEDHRSVRMKRDIYVRDGVDHVTDSEELDDDKLPIGAFPWTPDREAFLHEILSTFRAIDARMSALFSGAPEAVAAQIDATAIPLLLAGNAAPPPRKKARSR